MMFNYDGDDEGDLHGEAFLRIAMHDMMLDYGWDDERDLQGGAFPSIAALDMMLDYGWDDERDLQGGAFPSIAALNMMLDYGDDDMEDLHEGAFPRVAIPDMMLDYTCDDEENLHREAFPRIATPDRMLDYDLDDEEDFNRWVSSRMPTPDGTFDFGWNSEENFSTGAPWEIATSDGMLDYDWDVDMEQGGIEDLTDGMIESMMDEIFIKDFAEEIRELVARHQRDTEVAMITSYVIHLPDEKKRGICDRELTLKVVTLVDEMSNISMSQPTQVHPFIIELPQREVLDTKAVPWEYPTVDVGSITQSGRCYAPKESEKEKNAVSEEDAK